MDFKSKWIEEKVLKTSHKKNYEKYPNQMKQELQKQAEKNNMEIYSYVKDYYNLVSVLKDKNDDRYICVRINDFSCFENRSYSCVSLSIMKNPKIFSKLTNQNCCWNNIGITARRLLDLNKKKEQEKILEEEIER